MQTTLLSIAIAIILALIGALVGPYFVEWNQYRSEIEARASRMTGLNVRIAGAVEARLLPIPSLTLQRIAVARPGDAGTLEVRSLDVEFALGSLLRGELRATHVRLEGAQIEAGLDSAGRLDWSAPAMAVDPDTISIEQLEIVDSRAILTSAVSGSSLVLEKLHFAGEVRSLVGPVKGEGAFTTDGHRYPYRIAASRAGEDGGVRLRLNVELVDRPLIADADAFVFIEKGVPRYEGTLQLARPVGTSAAGIIEPWRMTARMKGGAASAGLEQIEFQYGPDDHRAVRVRGKANLMLGRFPQIEAELAATQVDLDRVLEPSDAAQRRPLVAIQAAVHSLFDAGQFPVPLRLNVRVENLVLAGSTLQSFRSELRSDGDIWDIEQLEFRAPGAAHVRLIGRLEADRKGLTFVGPAKIDARDTRAFLAWLVARPETGGNASGPLKAEGRLRISREGIAIDRVNLDGDRMVIEQGDIAYWASTSERPARFNGNVRAADLDLDRFYLLAQGIFEDVGTGWPSEGEIKVKTERGMVAGVEVKRADVAVRYDRQTVEIERFALGDFGGTAVVLNGQILSRTTSPQGTVTVDLDARGLDGLATLLDRIDPTMAAELRRRAFRLVPGKARATLVVSAQPSRTGVAPVRAALTFEGSVGSYRVTLQGNADDIGDLLASGNFSQLAASKSSLVGMLRSDDGPALIEVIGLEPFVVVDKRPAQLDLRANGTIDGEIDIVGRIAAGGLEVSSTGKVRLSGEEAPTAALDLKAVGVNFRNPRPVAQGRPVEVVPAALTGRVALAKGVLGLNDLEGFVAGTEIRGHLAIGLGSDQKLSGELHFGELALPAVIGAAIGVPAPSSGVARVWPSEPFERGVFERLNGRVSIKAARVFLSPNLTARNVRAVVEADQSTLVLKDIVGSLASGQVAGSIAFERGLEGVAVRTRVQFTDADLTELIRGGPPPLSGRLALDVTLEGSGRSPVAIIGSLDGKGTFSVKEGRIRRVDPAVFDAVVGSVDKGLPIDVQRISDRIEQALGTNGMAVPQAEGTIALAAGQARLNNLVVRSDNAELTLGGSAVLAEDLIEARMTLLGAGRTDGPGGLQPEIGISLKGPVDSPRRTLDVASFTNWLSLRAADQKSKRIDVLESGQELPVDTATTPQTPGAGAPAAPFARGSRAARNPPEPLPTIVRPRSLVTPPLDIRPPVTTR